MAAMKYQNLEKVSDGIFDIFLSLTENNSRKKLEKAAQGIAQCEVSAYVRSCRRCVATYWKEQARRSQNCLSRDLFLAHYYACKFGLNRLRIDGDIRQKPL